MLIIRKILFWFGVVSVIRALCYTATVGAARESESALMLRDCPSVRLSPKYVQKRNFLKKLCSLELWSLLTTYKEVLHGLFKEPIIGPLKFKMADIRHLENREIAISQR